MSDCLHVEGPEITKSSRVYTKIVSAQIYSSKALICRRGEVSLKAGQNRFCIVGLGSVLHEEESLCFEFLGDVPVEHCRISEIKLLDFEIDCEEACQLETLKNEEAMLREKVESLEAQKAAWKINSDFTRKSNVSLEQAADYIEALPKRLADIAGHIREENDRLARCLENQKRLQEALDKKKKMNSAGIFVDVSAAAEGTYSFELSYVERMASWKPFYELRMESLSKPLHVCMRASITQNTREDWNDIALTLFYGNIHQSNAIPVLRPQYMNFSLPGGTAMRSSVRLEPARPVGALSQASGAASENRPGVLLTEPVEAVSDIFMRYEFKGRFDVPDGLSGTVVDIARFDMDAVYIYSVIPQKADCAFLKAGVKDFQKYSLIPGRAELFIGHTYIGSTHFSCALEEDTLAISLGRERRIHTKRSLLRKYHSAARFKNTQVQNYEYEITIANEKEEAVSLKAFDQLPVSRDSEIIVEALELSGGTVNSYTGEVAWDLTLLPKERKVLRLLYAVTWPRNKVLSGEFSAPAYIPGKEENTVIFCPGCGAPVEVGTVFCLRCGSKIN